MKKSKVLMAAMPLILACLFSCNSEPEYHLSYIQMADVQKKLADGMAGSYSGKMHAYMDDTATHVKQEEDGKWVRAIRKDSLLNFRYIVGGYGNQHVTLIDFPISWFAHTISDTALVKVLLQHPPMPLQLTYSINRSFLEDRTTHKGQIAIQPLPLSLSLTYGGETHLIMFHLNDDHHVYEIDADSPETWNLEGFQLNLSAVEVDGVQTEVFDGFHDKAIFYAFVKGSRN